MRGGPAHRMLGTFDCRRSDSKLSRYRQCTVRVTGLRSVLSPFWDRPQRVQQPPRTGLAIAMSCKQVGLPLPGDALSVVTGSRCLSRGVPPDRMRSCFAELRGSFVQTRSRLRLSCCGRFPPVIMTHIRSDAGYQQLVGEGGRWLKSCSKSAADCRGATGQGSGAITFDGNVDHADLIKHGMLRPHLPTDRHRAKSADRPLASCCWACLRSHRRETCHARLCGAHRALAETPVSPFCRAEGSACGRS